MADGKDLGNALKKKAGDSMNYVKNGFDNLAESTKKLSPECSNRTIKKTI